MLVRLSAVAVLLAILTWLAVKFVAPEIVMAAYRGRSIAILNSLITGQREHPVGEYLAALSSLSHAVAFALLVMAAVLAVVASAARYPSQRRPVALFLAFVVCAAALWPIVLSMPIGVFDEGFVVSGAMLIRQGDLPIRDFFVIYGPGQYYLTAGVFTLFDEDLLVSRALHVMLMGLLGVAVAACTSTLVPRSRAWPALASLAYLLASGILWINPGYASIPAALLLMCACSVFAQWAETGARPHLLGASVLIGLAGIFRWDFGIFGLLAMKLATGVLLVARRAPRIPASRVLAAAIAPGLALLVLAFAPFIAVGGAARWFDEVPLFLLLEFGTWRNLEFIKPALWGIAKSWSAGSLLGASEHVVHLAYAAAAVSAPLAAILTAGAQVWRRRGVTGRADALALLLGLIALFLLNQMRVRSGFPQGFPALVASLPLIAYVLAAMPARGPIQRATVAGLGAALTLLIVLAPLHAMQSRLRSVMASAGGGGLDLPRATVVRLNASSRARKEWDEYAELVRFIRATTAQEEPILSAVADTSRLFVNDAMLYFLADRPAATRWVEMEPGLANTELGQRELIDALKQRNVRTVVLLTLTRNDEPNATARSNGIHLFDDYMHQNFTFSRRFGAYEVFMRRGKL